MNFEESTLPLTELLLKNGFSVSKSSINCKEYFLGSILISIFYNEREHLLFIQIGSDHNSLNELSPEVVKSVFNDDQYRLQSTLTIDNLVSFLKAKGQSILSGDISKINEINEFSFKQSREYTADLIYLQNLKVVDKAWNEQNYSDFIKGIDKIDHKRLPESYLKKYKIAVGKL